MEEAQIKRMRYSFGGIIMTRGQIAIITADKKIITSIEFNGDMYPSCHGAEVLKLLSEVEDEKDHERIVREFNNNNHKYDDEDLTFAVTKYSIEQMMDMTQGYFDKWSSDYIYIKNLSDDNIEWIDREGLVLYIPSGTSIAINFGEYTGLTDSNIASFLTMQEIYPELDEADLLVLIDEENEDRICGIYEDEYDIGKDFAIMVYGIPDWLDNDRYINYEAIGAGIVENDSDWLRLPSGKYVHLA